MRTKSSYWASSKFANWIRGVVKPASASAHDWAVWRKEAKAANPIRYWIADEGLRKLQKAVDYIPDKLYNVKCYIANRWVDQTYAIRAHSKHIKRGQYRELSDKILPCLFDALVDFVEIDLALESTWNDTQYVKPKMSRFNPFYRWRCPEAGVANLNWQMSLVNNETNGYFNTSSPDYGQPTPQAIRAKELFTLYFWWTEAYANRPDPLTASGYSDYCDAKREAHPMKEDSMSLFDDTYLTPELRAFGDAASKKCQEMEEEYEKEEEEMLIRLIKIRQSFWT